MKNRLIELWTRFVTFGDRIFVRLVPHYGTSCPLIYHFKSYIELFQAKPENPSFYTHMTFKHALPYFKTFIKLLVCKAHWADPRTETALYNNILLLIWAKAQIIPLTQKTVYFILFFFLQILCGPISPSVLQLSPRNFTGMLVLLQLELLWFFSCHSGFIHDF